MKVRMAVRLRNTYVLVGRNLDSVLMLIGVSLLF